MSVEGIDVSSHMIAATYLAIRLLQSTQLHPIAQQCGPMLQKGMDQQIMPRTRECTLTGLDPDAAQPAPQPCRVSACRHIKAPTTT